jgi:hypothetical protein
MIANNFFRFQEQLSSILKPNTHRLILSILLTTRRPARPTATLGQPALPARASFAARHRKSRWHFGAATRPSGASQHMIDYTFRVLHHWPKKKQS